MSLEQRRKIGKNVGTLVEMTPGMTNEKLAELLHYKESSGFISEVRAGRKTPSVPKLHAIEDIFNLPRGKLLEDKEYTEKEIKLLQLVSQIIEKSSDPKKTLRAINALQTIEDKKSPHYKTLIALLDSVDQNE